MPGEIRQQMTNRSRKNGRKRPILLGMAHASPQGSISLSPAPFPGKPFPCCTCSWSSDTCSRLRWRSARSSRPTCGCSRSSPRTRSGSPRRTRSSPASSCWRCCCSTSPAAPSSSRAWASAPTTSTTRSCRPRSAWSSLLTLNAFVLHHVTFPRLARGRRVPRWNLVDWIVVAVPVATSNFLWMFCAFLGIARPWNYSMPLRDILEIAAALYLVVQFGVFTILAMAGRNVQPDHRGWADRLARSLAAVGSLGRTEPRRRRRRSRRRGIAAAGRRRPMPRAPAPPRCRRPTEPPLEVDASGASPGGQPAAAAPALGALGRAAGGRGAPRPADHRLEQVIDHRLRLPGPAGVHRRGLDDGAARRHQPVEALARR